MKVGIPKEIYPHERRVAAVPETVHKIRKLGYEVVVEAGAGDASAFADAVYIEAGATIAPNAKALYAEADVVLKVRQPVATAGGHEVDLLKEGRHAHQLHLAGAEQGASGAAGRAQGDRAGHGRGPAHHARAAHGRAVGHGQHRRATAP